MKEDYCNYDLSLALKACGFDEPCDSYYNKTYASDDEYWHTKREEAYNWNGLDSDCQISAPTLWHAAKWLREKYGLHVVGLPCMDSASDADGQVCDEWQFWFFDIMQVSTARFLVDGEGQFDSYEQALSEGIKSAIELIKKGE